MERSDRWLEMDITELRSYIDEYRFPKAHSEEKKKEGNISLDSSLFLSLVLP